MEVANEQSEALIEAGVAKAGRQVQEVKVVEDEAELPQGDFLEELGFEVLKEIATTEGIEIAQLESIDALREAIRAKRAESLDLAHSDRERPTGRFSIALYHRERLGISGSFQ